jgi:hypothetical protein
MRIATKAVLHQTAKPRRGMVQCIALGSMTKEPGWAEIEGDGKWMHRRADLERSNWDEHEETWSYQTEIWTVVG